LTLATDSGSGGRGAALALTYALGLGLPFLALAAGFGWAGTAVGFVKRHIRTFNLAGGGLLIVLGLLLATGLWNSLVALLQEAVVDFVPAI
jgi:cytochrome c-type biogenesis protein